MFCLNVQKIAALCNMLRVRSWDPVSKQVQLGD